MTASAWSVALIGLEGRLVEVEAALGGGLPKTVIVGLPDPSLNEAKERTKAAVANSALPWPDRRITLNLTPATLPKSGSHYDMAMAVAVMAADGKVPRTLLGDTIMMGELGLDGRVHEVPGILPGLLAGAQAGFSRAIVPVGQLGEALLVEGLTIWGAATMIDVVEILRGNPVLHEAPPLPPTPDAGPALDLSDVVGQPEAKWALEVAAAGRHHLFMQGPPGIGKTMLACRMPTLLPDLTADEAIEVSAVHSLAGIDLTGGLIMRPPYSQPHHSASLASLVGGGVKVVRPGLISLAHRGVLFLDEAPEFAMSMMQALRTPLESGWVTISRAVGEAKYPANFQLLLAANPCPCGFFGVPGSRCRCAPQMVAKYGTKVSGPILDRIDIRQRLTAMRKSVLALAAAHPGEGSAAVAGRVAEARQRQARRLAGSGWLTNGDVSGSFLRKRFPPSEGVDLLDEAVRRGRMSARGVDKALRVAWTLADLAGRDRVGINELMQALAMRNDEGEAAA